MQKHLGNTYRREVSAFSSGESVGQEKKTREEVDEGGEGGGEWGDISNTAPPDPSS